MSLRLRHGWQRVCTWVQRKRKKIPRRFLVYSLILLFLAGLPFWPGPRPLEINLTGTPAEMGTKLGSKYKIMTKILARIYIKGFICQNREPVVQKR